MSEASFENVKAEARRMIDALPENATWDDVMYGIYVRQCVEAGLQDAETGDVVDVSDVRKRFGLVP